MADAFKVSSSIPGGLFDKATSIVKKAAPFVGGLHAFLGDPTGDGRGLEGAPAFIMERIMQNPLWAGKPLHVANPITTTLMALNMPDKYPIIPGAVSALIGWILEAAGDIVDMGKLGQLIGTAGSAMKGYGKNAALWSLPAAWIYLAPFNDSVAGSTGPMHTAATGYSGGKSRGGPGAANTYWQVRGGANIRNSVGTVGAYPI